MNKSIKQKKIVKMMKKRDLKVRNITKSVPFYIVQILNEALNYKDHYELDDLIDILFKARRGDTEGLKHLLTFIGDDRFHEYLNVSNNTLNLYKYNKAILALAIFIEDKEIKKLEDTIINE